MIVAFGSGKSLVVGLSDEAAAFRSMEEARIVAFGSKG